MRITVDGRKVDPKSRMTIKYYNESGTPIQYKPVRDTYPEPQMLTPLALFIVRNCDGTYQGGFLIRENSIKVEGHPGSEYECMIRRYGKEHADRLCKCYEINKETERAIIEGWLCPVFEPGDDDTRYWNRIAREIENVGGPGSRVIINDQIFNIWKH